MRFTKIFAATLSVATLCAATACSSGTSAGETEPTSSATESTSSATESTSTEPTTYTDVAYASQSESQTFDLYLPEDAEVDTPLIILVHGGGFAMGDSTSEPINQLFDLVDEGYAVASINYRLSGEATFPAAVADAKGAVRYLRANADDYGLDTDDFTIWGESAGAYIATMVAVTGDDELTGDVTDNADTSSEVQNLVDFYGPTQFYAMDEDFQTLGVTEADRSNGPIGGGLTNTEDSFESKFVGQNVGTLSEEQQAEIDAVGYAAALEENSDLRVVIQHGDADTNVPYLQSERLADALTESIGSDSVSYTVLEGAVHMDEAFYTDDNVATVLEFLQAD